jgi:hypothetical protein
VELVVLQETAQNPVVVVAEVAAQTTVTMEATVVMVLTHKSRFGYSDEMA